MEKVHLNKWIAGLVGALLLLSSAANATTEKNSTAFFPVGELGEQWEFTSDHLPIGATVNGLLIVNWNILDTAYLGWIENNGQGLKNSAIMRDNRKRNGKSGITVRDNHVVSQILEMVQNPVKSPAVLSLEEVGADVYYALKAQLPNHIKIVSPHSEPFEHADIFLYDSRLLDQPKLESAHYTGKDNTWLMLTLREKSSGRHYVFVASHIPGGPDSERYRLELANEIFTRFDPSAISMLMGDHNRSPDIVQKDLIEAAKQLGWAAQPFKTLDIPYPTHVNTLREASWIDNLFIAAPVTAPLTVDVVSNPGDLFKEAAAPVSTLWKLFALNSQIEKTRDTLAQLTSQNASILKLYDQLVGEWTLRYLYSEKRFDLERLIAAVAYAAEMHQGQVRKDSAHTPYIIHPLQVAQNVWREGEIANVNVLTAALLHDTLEDTHASPEEISERFGHRVLETVREVTNDPSLNGPENKQRQIDHAPHMSLDAATIKLADRLANTRDMKRETPAGWDADKVNAAYSWAQKLLDALRGSNKGLEQALEVELAGQVKK